MQVGRAELGGATYADAVRKLRPAEIGLELLREGIHTIDNDATNVGGLLFIIDSAALVIQHPALSHRVTGNEVSNPRDAGIEHLRNESKSRILRSKC